MPNLLLDSRSTFDAKKILLSKWLKQNTKLLNVLDKTSIDFYKPRNFVAGWNIEVGSKGASPQFHVLIEAEFPYSPIRVAYKSEDVYQKWPHVEPENVFCLPRLPSPFDSVENAIHATLHHALVLIDQCQNPQYIEDEFRKEFVSYWGHQAHSINDKVISLLDISNRGSRAIAVWRFKGQLVVGESAAQLSSWLNNYGRNNKDVDPYGGFFCFLDEAPIPPFPSKSNDMLAILKKRCQGVEVFLNNYPENKKLLFVLAAKSPTGVGLVSTEISAPSSLNGFRKNTRLSLMHKTALWSARSSLWRRSVVRNDHSWIHGRGVDGKQEVLRKANVVFLGCGSLGSHVAVRLAQSGVGGITLVDPEQMIAANAGRHVLGLGSVGEKKATELAKHIGLRFPHLVKIESYDERWQVVYEDAPEVFLQADLIVVCIGEWSAEGQLSEWYSRENPKSAILYGWLDELGTASHALALSQNTPALSCVLDENGRLRIPETLWEDLGKMQIEPACGETFQPFGAVDIADAEALVSRLCIDIITKKNPCPIHRVHAGPTEQLKDDGGEWSPYHLTRRPKGFEGSFVYERPVEFCKDCNVCMELMN